MKYVSEHNPELLTPVHYSQHCFALTCFTVVMVKFPVHNFPKSAIQVSLNLQLELPYMLNFNIYAKYRLNFNICAKECGSETAVVPDLQNGNAIVSHECSHFGKHLCLVCSEEYSECSYWVNV